MPRILVTGGAGYIGSACVKSLIEKGYEVTIVDNLSKGLKRLIHPKARFIEVDLADKEKLSKVFFEKIDAVIHFAAYKAVGESMKNPKKYSDNITGTINLLDAMSLYKVKKIIFSSSAAVYGVPNAPLLKEETPCEPINYYGFTKLECERIISWYSKINGINYVSLRYFNVAGDCGLHYVDPEAENVFPILMEVIQGKRDKFVIYGKDYDTRDGTCIRDYVDVNDLVEAHIYALNAGRNEIINLGTSNGVSVKELVDITIDVTGVNFPYIFGEKRAGDAPIVVASNLKAKKILKWMPKKTVRDMIKSTFEAYQA